MKLLMLKIFQYFKSIEIITRKRAEKHTDRTLSEIEKVKHLQRQWMLPPFQIAASVFNYRRKLNTQMIVTGKRQVFDTYGMHKPDSVQDKVIQSAWMNNLKRWFFFVENRGKSA